MVGALVDVLISVDVGSNNTYPEVCIWEHVYSVRVLANVNGTVSTVVSTAKRHSLSDFDMRFVWCDANIHLSKSATDILFPIFYL